MPIISASDQPRLDAIGTAYDTMPPGERAVLRGAIESLVYRRNEQGIPGVGFVTAREVLAAVGMKMAEREGTG